MSYTVIWQHKIVDAVAAIYLQAREAGRNTDAITQAVARIDSSLLENPASRGESRNRYERILIMSPLSVHFEVYEDERIVLVTSVRYHLPRHP